MAYFCEKPTVAKPRIAVNNKIFFMYKVLVVKNFYSGSKPSIKVKREAPFNPDCPGVSLSSPMP